MLWTTSDHTLSWPPPTIVSVTFLTEPCPRSTSILDRPGTFCYANNIPQLKTLPSVNAISVFTKRSYVHKENILMTYFPSNLSVKGGEWIASMMQPPRGKLFLFTCFLYFFKIGWDVSREQHRNMYTIKGETDHQPRLDAWDKRSGLVHWEDPEVWDGVGGGRGDRDGDHM